MRTWSTGSRPEQKALAADLAKGIYGSDALALQIVREFIAGLPAGSPGVLLDGFPRTMPQFEAWRAAAIKSRALFVEADAHTCASRLTRRATCPRDGLARLDAAGRPCLKCGTTMVVRSDDRDPVVVKGRFETYERTVGDVVRAWKAAKMPLMNVRNVGSMAELRASLPSVLAFARSRS
jgi:adenylate kinase